MVNRDYGAVLAFRVGVAAAVALSEQKARPLFTIGKDTRISSDLLEAALIAGLCSAGADVIRLGVIPTPAVAYLVRRYGYDAAPMPASSFPRPTIPMSITASRSSTAAASSSPTSWRSASSGSFWLRSCSRSEPAVRSAGS